MSGETEAGVPERVGGKWTTRGRAGEGVPSLRRAGRCCKRKGAGFVEGKEMMQKGGAELEEGGGLLQPREAQCRR